MKRGADLSSSPIQPPAKRRAYDLPPSSSPFQPRTPDTNYPSSPTRSFKSPYPPIPVDSPSNPLGRKRSLASCSSLPLPTTFGQHLPFRFQLIRPGAKKSEDVYRIVQVPLSYTFSHLKVLIWYLFGGSYVSRTSEALLKDTEHVFEIKENVILQDALSRPGTLKTGDTVVKLSSTLNPFGYNTNDDDEDSDADAVDLEDAEEKWKWEAEEDVPLTNLWHGPHVDLNKAILYVSLLVSLLFCKFPLNATATDTISKGSPKRTDTNTHNSEQNQTTKASWEWKYTARLRSSRSHLSPTYSCLIHQDAVITVQEHQVAEGRPSS